MSSGPAPDLSQLAIDLYQHSHQGVTTQAGEALVQAKRVRRTLFAAALAQTMVIFGSAYIAAMHHWAPYEKIAVASSAFLALLFWALCVWSDQSPLPAAIAGLTVYFTMWWATSAYQLAVIERMTDEKTALNVMHPTGATLVRLMIVISMCRAVYAGVKHRRLVDRAAKTPVDDPNSTELPLIPPALSAAGAAPRRIAGVGTSVALFLVLLYLCINQIALWGSRELTPDLYVRLVGVMAMIIVVWSIACWRDVYRPLAKAINPMWYVGAIAGGFATFAFAGGVFYLMRVAFKLPDDIAAASPDDAAQSWQMQLLLVAITPAIIEEIAFRGVMFEGLSRTLRGWEVVVVTALMFMVLHCQVPRFPVVLAIGLLTGWTRLRSGSWLPGVFLHFTHNFLCLIAGTA